MAKQMPRERGREAALEAFWDSQAARYDAAYELPTRLGRFLRSRRTAVLTLLGDGPGDVLDVGMGPGRVLEELATRGWTVSGVDVSAEMVAIARRRLPGVRERLVQASLDRLSFPDQRFDAVVATGVLGDTGWSMRALAAVAGVLRPGGLAVLSLPNRAAPARWWRHAFVHPARRGAAWVARSGEPVRLRRCRPPRRRSFERMLEAAGLEVESLRRASPAMGLLAGQLVYAARKPADGPLPVVADSHGVRDAATTISRLGASAPPARARSSVG